MTIYLGKSIYNPLFLSLSNIYIRYLLSTVRDLLYRSTTGSLTFINPISLSLLLRATILPSIYLIILFSWPMVTTYKSTNGSPIPVSPCKLNIPGIVVITTFSGIFVVVFYYNCSSKYIIKPYRKYYGRLVNGLGI